MKNIYLTRIFLLLFASSISFTSCSSDDDGDGEESNGTGNASYAGTEINLTQGYLSNYGEYEGFYNFDIILLSEGLEVDFSNDEMEGTGEMIYFEMWTDQSSGLKNGTYTFSNSDRDFGLTSAEFALNFSNDYENGSYFQATDGEVTLNKSGNTYTIDFDITFENGKSLTGRYVGNLFKTN